MTDRPLSLQLPLHDTDNNIQSQMLTTKVGSLAPVIPLLHPWKARNRSTFFALFALISVSAYLLFLAYPALTLALPGRTKLPGDGTNDPIRAYFHRKQKAVANHTTPAAVELDMAQELAAVSSFLASLPQNVIPSSIDPTKPIDPHIVLDFDTRSPRAAEEIQSMVNEVWSRNPVMLYGKHWSPVSREIKRILNGMNLNPPPTIFEVDLRDDAKVLGPIITRLTSSDLPVLLVGGHHVGSPSDIRSLNESGELRQMIAAAGAVANGATKRRGRRRLLIE